MSVDASDNAHDGFEESDRWHWLAGAQQYNPLQVVLPGASTAVSNDGRGASHLTKDHPLERLETVRGSDNCFIRCQCESRVAGQGPNPMHAGKLKLKLYVDSKIPVSQLSLYYL